MINDRRKDKSAPWGFVVCTDSFLSGWGDAKNGRSLYALPVDSPEQADIVEGNARRRSEMKRPHLVDADSQGLPDIKMKRGDHLSIPDPSQAQRWYTEGGF